MKKLFFAVIPALLFASCSFWNEPVEEFFSYWSSEAFITDSSAKVPNQSDKAGVVSGYDMTVEAAVAKLMFLLGRYNDNEKIKKELNTSLRGEVTII